MKIYTVINQSYFNVLGIYINILDKNLVSII